PQRRAQDPPAPADKAEALRLTPVSHETESRLDRYLELLREWQAKTNLDTPASLDASRRRLAPAPDVRPEREDLGRPRQRRRLSRCGARLRAGGESWSGRASRRTPFEKGGVPARGIANHVGAGNRACDRN